VLFPLWVVSEYVIRKPLGWAVINAERANLHNVLLDFFTFGPDRDGGIVPTALFDFGFRPSVGLYFFWDNAGFQGHDLRLYAATGGTDWLKASFADRIAFGPRTLLEQRVLALSRPDFLYAGQGWNSSNDALGRYASKRYEASIGISRQLSAFGWFNGFVGVRRATFEGNSCCDDPSITRRVAQGAYALPSGFDDGYSIARQGLSVELDTRTPRPGPGSGVRAVLRGEHAARLTGASARQFVRFGGSLSGFWDVTNYNRVLSLSVAASFADPVADDSRDIPFTEAVQLGGEEPLRGFLEGRLVDRSALVARLGYAWPIWALLDGSLQAELGNVFAEHLQDFAPDRTRLSFGLGLRSAGRRDHPFEILIGTGTTPLEDGAQLDSFRLVFGATNAF
jgi:outer membrane protein assembly factor BamA